MIKKGNEEEFKYLTENDQKHFKDSLEYNKELMKRLSKL